MAAGVDQGVAEQTVPVRPGEGVERGAGEAAQDAEGRPRLRGGGRGRERPRPRHR